MTEVNQEARLFKVINRDTNEFVMISHYMTIQGTFKFHPQGTRRMLRETSLPEHNYECFMYMNGKPGVPCQRIAITEWKGQI